MKFVKFVVLNTHDIICINPETVTDVTYAENAVGLSIIDRPLAVHVEGTIEEVVAALEAASEGS